MSRVVGIAIQTVYERCEARQGKGTPIIRPKYFYSETGSTATCWRSCYRFWRLMFGRLDFISSFEDKKYLSDC